GLSVSSTILHEVIHQIEERDVFLPRGKHTDLPYDCEQACFNTNTGNAAGCTLQKAETTKPDSKSSTSDGIIQRQQPSATANQERFKDDRLKDLNSAKAKQQRAELRSFIENAITKVRQMVTSPSPEQLAK